MLVQTKSFRCPAEHCVFVYIGKTPPAFLLAPHCVRAVGSLRRFVPSHIDKLVMHKNRLSLVRPRRRGVPSAHPIGYTYKVSKARTPHEGRAFAHPMHFKCRNALSNTESVSRSVQILDLYPRLASITIIDFDKKSEIFCHM